MLDLLRQLLLLLCVWNKTLPKPIIPASSECRGPYWGRGALCRFPGRTLCDLVCAAVDGALALLFKVLTVFNLSPQSPLSEELQSGQQTWRPHAKLTDTILQR